MPLISTSPMEALRIFDAGVASKRRFRDKRWNPVKKKYNPPAIATMDKTEIWLIGMNRKRQMLTVKTWPGRSALRIRSKKANYIGKGRESTYRGK